MTNPSCCVKKCFRSRPCCVGIFRVFLKSVSLSKNLYCISTWFRVSWTLRLSRLQGKEKVGHDTSILQCRVSWSHVVSDQRCSIKQGPCAWCWALVSPTNSYVPLAQTRKKEFYSISSKKVIQMPRFRSLLMLKFAPKSMQFLANATIHKMFAPPLPWTQA